MKIIKPSTITEMAVVLFAILFLYTGISKLIDYTVFKEQLAASPILATVSGLIAASLPFLEFLVVILLLVPRWRLKGFFAAFALMSLFTIYIIGLFLFDKEMPCSCGGIISLLSWEQHIFLNCFFIALAGAAISMEKKIKNNQKKNLESLNNNYAI